MKKINEQLIVVAVSIAIVIIVLILVSLFQDNKVISSQSDGIKLTENANITMVDKEKIKIADKDPAYSPEYVAENNFIPLSKGSYWLYRITGEQFVGDGQNNEIIKTNELFKIEVLNSIRRDANLRAALLNGYPGRSMTTSTLIIVSEKDYYLIDSEEPFRRILNIDDDLTDLYYKDNPILSFPLTNGKKFGCDEYSINRKDNYYCYWIESIKPADASIFPNKTQYQISYYTLPDASSYYYVDGVGITYATYHHNGSLNDERWNLVKYSVNK